jgi:drug/metabolite transporter (DMT)-like permease
LLFETRVVNWSPTFIATIVWLALALSVGSIGVLYWLIRHSAATKVASLFYLVPGVTALMAYGLFDERLDLLSIAGMAICAAGVIVVNRR